MKLAIYRQTNASNITSSKSRPSATPILTLYLTTFLFADFIIFIWAKPDIAQYIAQEVPREIYEAVGESTLETMDEEQFKPSTLSIDKQKDIREQFDTIVADLALDSTRYQLHFRDWEGGINAFALMNGAIVVTDALVQTLDEPLQLNTVLLHEIGHINNNHLMENTLRVSIFYITLSMIVGDISVVADLLVEASKSK
jgi:Zn-dependent protease with chaperone function